jgi:hypothetical protein
MKKLVVEGAVFRFAPPSRHREVNVVPPSVETATIKLSSVKLEL